jgi:hypothetical protein
MELAVAPDGGFAVPASIDGKKVLLSLDLDGSLSVHQRFAESSGLRLRRFSRLDHKPYLDGQRVTQVARIDSLDLGDWQVGRTAAFVDPRPTPPLGQDLSHVVVGSVGLNLFRSYDFELDLADHKLHLYWPDHCTGKVVHWAEKYSVLPMQFGGGGHLYFTAELAGEKLAFNISPDKATTTLTSDAAKVLYGFDATPRDDMTLNIGGLELQNVGLRVVPTPALKCAKFKKPRRPRDPATHTGCDGVFPLTLGGDVLKRLHLFVSLREKKLYFTPADAGRENRPSAPALASAAASLRSSCRGITYP